MISKSEEEQNRLDRHTCRESSDPRCKGRCACGKKIDPLTNESIGPIEQSYHDQRLTERLKDDDFRDAYEATMRTFDTGATRDTDEGKLDYAGFLSPYVLHRFAAYMHSHRVQSDGTLRDSDNWKKGIPLDAYFSSAFRHFMEWWELHDGGLEFTEDLDAAEEAICALLFNCMGYLHTIVDS